MSDVGLVEHSVRGASDVGGDAACPVITEPGPHLRRDGCHRRSRRTNIDDAAARIAVERRRRTAYGLDPAHRFEIEIVHRCLAVGERERHSVTQDANAADAE